MEDDLACVHLVHAEQAADELGSAGSHEPEQTHDLPRSKLHRHSLHRLALGDPAGLVDHVPDLLFHLRVDLLEISADHHLYHLGLREPGLLFHAHESPITEHGDPVAEGEDVLQDVGDVDDGDSPLPVEVVDDPEEILLLFLRQRGCRFVEYDDLRFFDERLCDLHCLANTHRNRPDFRSRCCLDAEGVDVLLRLRSHCRVLHRPQRARGQLIDEDVLRHGQVGEKAQLLVDEGNPCSLRILRVRRLERTAIQLHAAAVARPHAAKDVHQGRLPCAVLAHEAQHFTTADLEIDSVQHLGAEEALCNFP